MIDCIRVNAAQLKRWSSGEVGLRWTAAGMLEAEMQFRKVIGYPQLPQLAVRSNDACTFTNATPPRRPLSQSLCNRHTRAAVPNFHDERCNLGVASAGTQASR